MAKYLVKRIIRGIISVIIVVGIVMLLIFSLMDRELVLSNDSVITKLGGNDLTVYKYQVWENYGYIDYVPYLDYLTSLESSGEIDANTRKTAATLGKTVSSDNATTAKYVKKFTEYYESKGYTVTRLKGFNSKGGNPQLFAYQDIHLLKRMWNYFSGILSVDSIHYADEIEGERGLSFTWYDPVYGGKKFSPAIMGNGTKHKYLLYFDNKFPFIHQNIVKINLGVSYSVNKGIDIADTMTNSQGGFEQSTIHYPTGITEVSADDLHSAKYSKGSRALSDYNKEHYTDDYTVISVKGAAMSKMGFSFAIGILSVIMAYILGVPLGIMMARNKDKLLDKLGTIYIVFIMAVPSLAYIFIFSAIGRAIGLPTTFSVSDPTTLMYILPIVSLALPSVANLMKWLRRYMIDQQNSDYVKFARSGGLSEREIFNKHILKNAIIPLVHGIPGSVLGALTGAIITERVYTVPGAGNLLTTAINKYDNSVIVGVTLFYAVLSVVSIILGDILMSMVDPRISFSDKAR